MIRVCETCERKPMVPAVGGEGYRPIQGTFSSWCVMRGRHERERVSHRKDKGENQCCCQCRETIVCGHFLPSCCNVQNHWSSREPQACFEMMGATGDRFPSVLPATMSVAAANEANLADVSTSETSKANAANNRFCSRIMWSITSKSVRANDDTSRT